MSTPQTATVTCPPSYHPHHRFEYLHAEPYPSSATGPYRSGATQGLPTPGNGRLAPSFPAPTTASSVYSAASSSQAPSNVNGSALSNYSVSTARSNRPDPSDLSLVNHNRHYTTVPAAPQPMPMGSQAPSESTQASRKRRRSREPREQRSTDWAKFYENGLPKEVIVIDDDSPEPESADVSAASASSRTVVNGNTTNGYTNGVNGNEMASSANASAPRHVAKRRKGNDEASTSGTHYDPVHGRMKGSSTNSNGTPTGSIISSGGRTNSAIHTTAATSLGSLSSNGPHDNESQVGQKRKRTRMQHLNEAKRRETAIIGQAYTTYHPPPHPPKKAQDVHVRVVPDVSCSISLATQNRMESR